MSSELEKKAKACTLNSVSRFSNRVANYVKYRPGYPAGVLRVFKDEMGLTTDSVVADIGSGTGISSRFFLENGNQVIGVEPNAAMRVAAEEYLAAFPNFRSVDGTAERTGLDENSVDFAVAAQAFHWFDASKARDEFARTLRPSGYSALIWNERQLDTNEFLRDYERLLIKFANDYEKVRHENIDENVLAGFFGRGFQRQTFENQQVLDLDGLKGRLLSASYMPAEGEPRYAEMIDELRSLFAKHAESGKIKLLYNTNIFFTQI
ncbi:MAG: class I SAM-dependent methyltransferase [Acidobacteriota bacterium]